MVHTIKKGLNLPINGVPFQEIANGRVCQKVALTGPDFVGMKPTMLVKEGESVKIGQPLFECKKVPGVIYTSPAAGKVAAINRGERRVFQALEIEVAETEEHYNFSSYSQKNIDDYSSEEIEKLLVESGQWVGLRTRPYSRSPRPRTRPSSLFISVMDTNPLAADPEVVIADYASDFVAGVKILSKLAKVNLVKRERGIIPIVDSDNISIHQFSGLHPAGNVGTHIHFIDPVGPNKTVWHMGYQDVIGVGRLFTTGKLFVERVVALSGPKVFTPRLLRTRLGADLDVLVRGQLKDGPSRVVSGSIFNGRRLDDSFRYLGWYHYQISAIEEDTSREFLGWQGPGYDKYSVKNTFVGKFKNKSFDFTSKIFGSKRAIVPVGSFEKIMPLDILPTQLLKALVTNDTDLAQSLGALELDEEDLALCTFVSPGKEDFGPLLRENLTIIEKEG